MQNQNMQKGTGGKAPRFQLVGKRDYSDRHFPEESMRLQVEDENRRRAAALKGLLEESQRRTAIMASALGYQHQPERDLTKALQQLTTGGTTL